MDTTINIDAGGTFTDGVITHGEAIGTAKVPTTEHDLMDCIDRGATKLETSVSALLAKADVVRFSTTVGTNTVIEKTGPRLGLLVTEGHGQNLCYESQRT